MITIRSDIFMDFLNKIKMSSTQVVDECLLKFKDDGIYVSAVSPSKQVYVNAYLNKKAFLEYEEIQNVGLPNLLQLVNVFKRFKGKDVELSIDKNKLVVDTKGKNVKIELIAEQFFEEPKTPSFEYEEFFTLTQSELKGVFDDAKVNTDAEIKINTGEQKVKLSNTGKYQFSNSFDAPKCSGKVSVKFGRPLIDTLDNTTNDLDFSVKSDYPARVIEETEDSRFIYYIAPRVESK